jgi:poly-gamma-glutamate capsule biosynthesis protein CapA/YwtB (metallophosphatase superfamily)
VLVLSSFDTIFFVEFSSLINLETSVTTSEKMWPNKMFNYRMHPENVKALKVAKVDVQRMTGKEKKTEEKKNENKCEENSC